MILPVGMNSIDSNSSKKRALFVPFHSELRQKRYSAKESRVIEFLDCIRDGLLSVMIYLIDNRFERRWV